MLIVYTLCLVGFAAAWFFLAQMRKETLMRGKTEGEAAQSRKALEDVKLSNDVADRLRHDADYRKRVHDRFTRD